MKTIIQFLKSQIATSSEDSEKVDQPEKDIEKLRNLFSSPSRKISQTKHLKIRPRVQRNQIWTIKNEYDDFQGITQKASHLFTVLINSTLNEIEGEYFIRVLIISPFIEMATDRDEVCKDPSIIGFPFLVETWNDQPILVELLDEYIGYYELRSESFIWSKVLESENEPTSQDLKSENLNEILTEFRDVEISRAKYINHSVISLIGFLENRQSNDAGVVISLFDRIEYPKFFIGKTQKEPTLSLAAKSGIETEDRYLVLENSSLPFKIFIRKNVDGFIISVDSSTNMELLTNTGKIIDGLSNKEKTVFANLKAGNYILINETIKQPIKIRLK
jgi:hypothetical protein